MSKETGNSGKYLLLRPLNLLNNKSIQLRDGDKYIDVLETDSKKKSALHAGDIVISRFGKNVIKYVYKKADPPCVVNQMFVVIRAKNNEYIKTYMETKEGKELFNLQVDKNTVGGIISFININELREIQIPIIPISDLNRVSDRYIEETNSKEKLEALKRELKIQKAKNDSLERTNTQLMSFFNNRFDAIDKKLNTLIDKVDEVLDVVKGLETEVALIKTLQTNERQTIKFIEQKIDEATESISNDKLNTYLEIAKAWVDPNWFKLDLLSQMFLPNAELLFANISKMENGDPSTFIIQYCRTLENELLNKIFKPYIRDLKKRDIIIQEAFSLDLQLNENGNPGNRNRDSYKFAKQLLDLQPKDSSKWFFELGSMSLILIKMTGRHAYKSPLFQDFKEFILKLFDERFIDREYYELIFLEVRLLRNKASSLFDV